MPLVTPNQIANYAAQAGFSGADLVTAVAIALAESSGNTTATHHNSNGTTDYGLWQINSSHGSLLQMGSWSDGLSNARMAYSIYSAAGNKFTDWVTHDTGAYTLYLPQASIAAGTASAFLQVNGSAGGAQDWFNSQLIRANKEGVTPHVYVPVSWRKSSVNIISGPYTMNAKNGKGVISWYEAMGKAQSATPFIATFTYDINTGITDGNLAFVMRPPNANDPTVAQQGNFPGADAGAAIGKGANDILGGLGNLLIFGKLGNLDIGYVALIVAGGVAVLIGLLVLAKDHIDIPKVVSKI